MTERLERVKGIEPSYEAWEATVLPLNYTREAGDYLTAAQTYNRKSSRTKLFAQPVIAPHPPRTR